uniref:Uncharacterized protein n=1 Tax=Myoviridae sp. ctTrm2 TaxID=2825114 RepID=A0A8S5UK26_9CAUD|nr:MAG TPA: hypothetical protein [Myoviridae sp. ctTrm2]DAY51508.1 MAG TPA: hypothetical protein [Caudoviricetes sp.]
MHRKRRPSFWESAVFAAHKGNPFRRRITNSA